MWLLILSDILSLVQETNQLHLVFGYAYRGPFGLSTGMGVVEKWKSLARLAGSLEISRD
jgi:hypothetical protein